MWENAALAKGDVGLGNVDNTADVDKPVSTAQATADTATLDSAKTYADGLVVGLWDDRGAYDASVNTFPAAGGSGAAGAILKGDIWTVSVAGALGGVAVGIGDTMRAMVDAPAQVAANWSILENNTGYVPENAANKDASGGYPGLTLFKLNLRNAANTLTSWFTTAATVARTWTMPDKDGTVAMTSDLTAATITNTPAGGITETDVQGALNGLDSRKVSLTGNETIAGTKTFSSAIAGSITGNAATASGVLFKADHTIVAFIKTGAGTAEIKAGTLVEVDGTTVTFAAATAITMPTLTAGTDYAIYACADGTVRADASFSAPSGYTTANSRKIGGFHYAPGGNATGVAGGDTTPAINAYSFWDLKFKPCCPDPRGMALVANGFWSDIYLTGVDHYTNGTSKYNVTIADGSSPPKVPALFGGNGSTAYTTLTWWEAGEVARSHGKRLPIYDEFAALAYGTTEATSGGTDPVSTILRAAYTSKWGVMLSTGNLWVWGAEFGGPYGTAAYTANTGGRGSTYNLSNAAVFGGSWGNTSGSGSRASNWSISPTLSNNFIGFRAVCDLLILE